MALSEFEKVDVLVLVVAVGEKVFGVVVLVSLHVMMALVVIGVAIDDVHELVVLLLLLLLVFFFC